MKKRVQTFASILAIGLFIFLAFGSDDEGISTDLAEKQSWVYSEEDDETSGDKIYSATLHSSNQVEFAYPHHGGSYFEFIIKNSGKENETILRVSNGQFMPSVRDSEALGITFDEGDFMSHNYSSATDGSADYIFLSNPDSLIKKVKNAKKLKIEAPFFNAGIQVIKFDVDSLQWDR